MPTISTVIIARDESERLERCVQSCLPFSDEVLVIDGGSTDGTQQLATELGCRVIENRWPGYGAQRNFGARAATNDWIFSIDSDEAVDEELCRALKGLEVDAAGGPPAFSVHRINAFLGAWLTESPEIKVRLYDRRRSGFSESVVHEAVDVPEEAAALLPGRIWHENDRTLEETTLGLNRYTSLEAQLAGGRRMKVWRLFLRPPLRFLQRYVLQRAARHGWRGLFLALHWTYWELLREMKVYERELDQRSTSSREGCV